MTEFVFNTRASPRARSGKFSFQRGWTRAPTFFANLIEKTDRTHLVATINDLAEQGEPLLPYLGGVVVESQRAPVVLEGLEDVTQTELNGDQKDFTTLFDVLSNLNRNLVIDPNTDRLLFSTYRNEIKPIRDYLPQEILPTLAELDRGEPDIDYDEAYSIFKEEVSSGDLVDRSLQLQADYHSDLRIPPYYSIDADTLEEDLSQNINLIKITEDVVSEEYSEFVAPVIPLRRSVFAQKHEREGEHLKPPEEWSKIVRKYRQLDPDLLFVKATNVEMNPKQLDQTETDGIFDFFNLLRRNTGVPIIFLGLDEFAYTLMAHGLDGFSKPLYSSPYRSPKRGGATEGPNHRNFLIRRKLGWKTFDQLDSLGCHGPFCREYNGEVRPSDISLSDQDTLRRKHWFYVRNQEVKEVYDAIQKDDIRPGLASLYSDSAWKKNLTRYLDL